MARTMIEHQDTEDLFTGTAPQRPAPTAEPVVEHLLESSVNSIGSRLRAAREARGLSVADCGRQLHLPIKVLERLEAVFGAPVLEAYGMTEAAHQMASNPLPPRARAQPVPPRPPPLPRPPRHRAAVRLPRPRERRLPRAPPRQEAM